MRRGSPDQSAPRWLDTAVLNGQSLGPGRRTVVAPRGGEIAGTISLRSAMYASQASVILVAVPTWGDRTRNFVLMISLSPDSHDQRTSPTFRISAPKRPGHYHLILTANTETTGEFAASGTNWLLGRPRWFDGNDVTDWTEAQIAQANREGRTRMRWLYLRSSAGDLLTAAGGVSERSLRQVRTEVPEAWVLVSVPATVLDVVVR